MPQIKDKAASKYPRSRFLTTEELDQAQPNERHHQSLDQVFHPDHPEEFPREICQAFIEKYDAIVAVDSQGKEQRLKDELDDMDYNQLQSLASRYNVKIGKKKEDELRQTLREEIEKGDPLEKGIITPTSQDYYTSKQSAQTVLKRKAKKGIIKRENWKAEEIKKGSWAITKKG